MALEVDIMPNMKITVTKLTSPDLARLALAWTAWTGVRWVRAEIEDTPTINEVEL